MAISSELRRTGHPVLVNGCLYMYVENGHDCDLLLDTLRQLRYRNMIPYDTTLAKTDGYVIIDTDAGCMMRLLLRVEMLKEPPRLIREPCHNNLIDYLLQQRAIEYVDKQEENNLRVALSPLVEPTEGWGPSPIVRSTLL